MKSNHPRLALVPAPATPHTPLHRRHSHTMSLVPAYTITYHIQGVRNTTTRHFHDAETALRRMRMLRTADNIERAYCLEYGQPACHFDKRDGSIALPGDVEMARGNA